MTGYLGSGSAYLPTAGPGQVCQWFGVYPGKVTNTSDPARKSRIQCNVPQVLGTAVSNWAAPAGHQPIPPVGSVVNITFLGGDINQPAYTTPSVLMTSPAAAIGNGGTVSTNTGFSRVTAPAGGVTGAVLQPGNLAGQNVWVINESANSITFAAAGSSNVADGVSDTIAGLTARLFVWDSATSRWYRAG